MQPNRAPGTSWAVRKPGDYPQVDVRTIEGDRIVIAHHRTPGDTTEWVMVDRRTARLLAKRINQCLDATAKR